MGLSARTDDNTGLVFGEGFLTASTSAGNALYFGDPSSMNQYIQSNPAQFNKAQGTSPDGNFNDESQRPV